MFLQLKECSTSKKKHECKLMKSFVESIEIYEGQGGIRLSKTQWN